MWTRTFDDSKTTKKDMLYNRHYAVAQTVIFLRNKFLSILILKRRSIRFLKFLRVSN